VINFTSVFPAGPVEKASCDSITDKRLAIVGKTSSSIPLAEELNLHIIWFISTRNSTISFACMKTNNDVSSPVEQNIFICVFLIKECTDDRIFLEIII
jgi:hypothetical protein